MLNCKRESNGCCNRCSNRHVFIYPFSYTSINRHFNKFARSFWSVRLDIRWGHKSRLSSFNMKFEMKIRLFSTIDWLLLRKFSKIYKFFLQVNFEWDDVGVVVLSLGEWRCFDGWTGLKEAIFHAGNFFKHLQPTSRLLFFTKIWKRVFKMLWGVIFGYFTTILTILDG